MIVNCEAFTFGAPHGAPLTMATAGRHGPAKAAHGRRRARPAHGRPRARPAAVGPAKAAPAGIGPTGPAGPPPCPLPGGLPCHCRAAGQMAIAAMACGRGTLDTGGPGFWSLVKLPGGIEGHLHTTFLAHSGIGRTTGEIGDLTINCRAPTEKG